MRHVALLEYSLEAGRRPCAQDRNTHKIVALNQWFKAYAASKGYVYVDYYSPMRDQDGGLPAALSNDGVHPTVAGYAVMAPLVEAGIKEALKNRE